MSWLSNFAQQANDKININTKEVSKMKIEIWSDIMCPFCYIGKRNLETAMSQFASKEHIEIEWKSFQLDPNIEEFPKYQDNVFMYLAERKGMSIEQSKKIHAQVVEYAQSVGLDYHFEKAKVANSFKSHRLIQLAKTKLLGDRAEEKFFYAYFTEGKNLNDLPTLIELGHEIGLTEAEVNEALTNDLYAEKVENDCKEAQYIGVSGVPFFVLNRKYAISGAQQASDMLKTIEKAYSEWQLENPSKLQIQQAPACDVNGDCK
jgi:protein disulfide-isomerase